MSERVTRRVVVHGRVQGVGFREFMRREAAARGVLGWVRNRRDGSVEATIQGTAEAVDTVLAWMRHGPASAQVMSIDIESADGDFAAFEVRRTE